MSSVPRPRASGLARAAGWGVLLPAAVLAALIRRDGVDVPYWDQWDFVSVFEKLHRGTLTAGDLFAQQNEYRQFFPNLVFVALGRATRWDVRWEMWASFVAACLVALCIHRLGARTVRDPARRGVLFLAAGLLVFSPVQNENWLFGIQLVYFVPVLCAAAGLAAAGSGARFAVRFAACLALAAVATFSSANGAVCWAVLAAALAAGADPHARRWPWLAAWCAAAAGCAALYLHGYQPPRINAGAAAAEAAPLQTAAYFLAFTGRPFVAGPGRHMLPLALVAGAALTASYLLACALAWRARARPGAARASAPWLALGAYSLLTAVLVTAGRAGFGAQQALSPRYATFSLYLPLSLPYAFAVLHERGAMGNAAARRPVRRLAAAGGAAVLCVYLLLAAHGIGRMEVGRRARLQARACLLLIDVLPGERCAGRGVYPDARAVRASAQVLDRLGYLRPPLVRGRSIAPIARPGPRCAAGGANDWRLSRTGQNAYVATGIAAAPGAGARADAVLLAGAADGAPPAVFALALPELEPARGPPGWRAAFPAAALPPGSRGVSAWAFDAATATARPLCGTHPVHAD